MSAATTSLDLAAIRAEFPILHQQVGGYPLAYLDNAASAQKPAAVIDAIANYYRHDHANVHRGVHALSQRATAAYEDARRVVAAFLGGVDEREIVFTKGSTEALNLVANAWGGANLRPGDEVVLTEMEHHSNIVPWQLVAERTGAVIRAIPVLPDGSLDMDAAAALIGPRTRLVGVVHVSNALGTINPIARLVSMARAVGAAVLVDGSQAAPHLALDVRALGVDFYVFTGHKTYGPTGIGALYGRAEVLAAMPPWHGGGDMIRAVSFEGTTYAEPPARFEAGTPNIAGAVGLAAALRWMQGVGLDAIAAHEEALRAHATERLAAIDGLRIYGTTRHKAGLVSFTLGEAHPHDVGTLLDQLGIAVRTGHHCTQPLWRRFGVSATARASFAAYNTHDEVDRLADALLKVRRMLL
jgi:cysteine desulfurase/selenocysteine lyase